MNSFSPISTAIFNSSINEEDLNVRWVFLWLICKASKSTHKVKATIDAIGRCSNITVEQARKAMARLQQPDPFSTRQDEEGRRVIEEAPGLWYVVNHEYYLKQAQEEFRRLYMAQFMRAKREIGDFFRQQFGDLLKEHGLDLDQMLASVADDVPGVLRKEVKIKKQRTTTKALLTTANILDEYPLIEKVCRLCYRDCPKYTPDTGDVKAWLFLRNLKHHPKRPSFSADTLVRCINWAVHDAHPRDPNRWTGWADQVNSFKALAETKHGVSKFKRIHDQSWWPREKERLRRQHEDEQMSRQFEKSEQAAAEKRAALPTTQGVRLPAPLEQKLRKKRAAAERAVKKTPATGGERKRKPGEGR